MWKIFGELWNLAIITNCSISILIPKRINKLLRNKAILLQVFKTYIGI